MSWELSGRGVSVLGKASTSQPTCLSMSFLLTRAVGLLVVKQTRDLLWSILVATNKGFMPL